MQTCHTMPPRTQKRPRRGCADRQRWKQIYTGPSGTETTYYVGNGALPAPGQMEVVFTGTTNYRHYIYAGAEPIAVYSRTSGGTNTMSYVLEDHQGGVSAITSNAGATDVDQSYSAFGQLRNSQTWSGAPTTTQLNSLFNYTRQGYTLQAGLGQSMGLNHMNGRVEDAISGRMISPDPLIQDPSNAQNYNRYSYVNNNPLTLIDPTGFAGCDDPSEGVDEDCPDPGGGGGDGGTSDPFPPQGGCGSDTCLPPAGCGIPPYAPSTTYPTPPPLMLIRLRTIRLRH